MFVNPDPFPKNEPENDPENAFAVTLSRTNTDPDKIVGPMLINVDDPETVNDPDTCIDPDAEYTPGDTSTNIDVPEDPEGPG